MFSANTCFALLFLKRASVSSGKASRDSRVTRAAEGPVYFRVTKGQALALTLDGFDDTTTEAFSGEAVGGEGLRIREVRWFVDGKPLMTLPGKPGRAWKGERYAARYDADRNGAHVFAVEIDVLSRDARRRFGFRNRSG